MSVKFVKKKKNAVMIAPICKSASLFLEMLLPAHLASWNGMLSINPAGCRLSEAERQT